MNGGKPFETRGGKVSVNGSGLRGKQKQESSQRKMASITRKGGGTSLNNSDPLRRKRGKE